MKLKDKSIEDINKEMEIIRKEVKTIEIASDYHEGVEFVKYLRFCGYDAWLGDTTESFVNGKNTDSELAYDYFLSDMWIVYCYLPWKK